jgi:hypothetical protein
LWGINSFRTCDTDGGAQRGGWTRIRRHGQKVASVISFPVNPANLSLCTHLRHLRTVSILFPLILSEKHYFEPEQLNQGGEIINFFRWLYWWD